MQSLCLFICCQHVLLVITIGVILLLASARADDETILVLYSKLSLDYKSQSHTLLGYTASLVEALLVSY